MIKVYQDIVQPVVQFPWESVREHEPSRLFVSGDTEFFSVDVAALATLTMTMACFFNPTTTNIFQTMIWVGDKDSGANAFVLGLDNTGAVRGRQRGQGSDVIVTTTTATAGAWDHGIVTHTPSDIDVYLNNGGTANVTNTQIPANLDRTTYGYLGDSTPGSPFNGRIFWPCIWNVVLNESERARLVSGVPPWYVRAESIVSCPNLKTLYDPFMQLSFTNTGTIIANPFRDWTLPDDTALWGSVTGAAAITAAEIAAATRTQIHYIEQRQPAAVGF